MSRRLSPARPRALRAWRAPAFGAAARVAARLTIAAAALGPSVQAQVAPPAAPAPAPPPPAAAGQSARDALPALIEHSRRRLALEQGRLGGPALPWLRELLAGSRFVLFGEDHGSRGIANLATALWHELQALGWRHAAVEVDPFTAAELEARLRRGGAPWQAFLAAHGGGAVPFFAWDAELQFAQAVVHAAEAAGTPAPVLWGLDQVFIGAAPWLLQRMADTAPGPRSRERAAALARRMSPPGRPSGDDRKAQPEGAAASATLMSASAAELSALRQAWIDEGGAATLPDALQLSRQIYAPHTGGEGETWIANDARERLLKRNFAAQLQAVAPGTRVMLKFGAYHLFRGASPTQVQALGGFVSELAQLQGGQALSLMVLCTPGDELLAFDGSRVPCSAERYGNDWAFLQPWIDPEAVTVFDLRSWRLRPRRLAHLSAEVQRVLGSYDLLVFAPRRGAAAYLPGVAPPGR